MQNYQVSVAVKKVGGQLQHVDITLPSRLEAINRKLQLAGNWADRVRPFDWLNKVLEDNPTKREDIIGGLPEGIDHLVMARQGAVQFLSLEEIDKLGAENLDQAGVISQLEA